ncbi:MAG: bifunctional precorrin-2 dehydrogenase/sirohydrochlorin ferrochelatase [Mailhella sp.]|nr:bifunctional precorrin-2 dehydrogenase/sirohydrochlorin ferrochelatase [Mailhella sp.]
MEYYPLFLDLRGTSCLIVGFGGVGARKLGTLLRCGAGSVTVLDPGTDERGFAERAGGSVPCGVRFEKRRFLPSDLDGMGLVFAVSSDKEENSLVAALCRQKGIPCNSATAPEEGTFVVPASVRSGRLTLAVSTGGTSPALARAMREELEDAAGARYAPYLELMCALRPILLKSGTPSGRAGIFRALAERGRRTRIMDILERFDAGSSAALLRSVLEECVPAAALDELEAQTGTYSALRDSDV